MTKSGKTRGYIVYHDNSNGTTKTYFIRSKKNANFGPPFNITPGREGNFFPRVAVDSGGSIFVVWADTANGGQIILVRSTDLGINFSGPVNVSQPPGQAFAPCITANCNHWTDSARPCTWP